MRFFTFFGMGAVDMIKYIPVWGILVRQDVHIIRHALHNDFVFVCVLYKLEIIHTVIFFILVFDWFYFEL